MTACSYNLFTIADSGQNPNVVELTTCEQPIPIHMELDTGTSLSLLNKQTCDKIPNLQIYNQQIFNLRHSYTGEVLWILGEAKVTVSYAW